MQDNFKQNFLQNVNGLNKNLSKLNIFKNWIDTNRMLEEFYKRPEINIIDDTRGLNIKNSMRHIVGSSKYQQDYGNLTNLFGDAKENWDIKTQPYIYMLKNKNLDRQKYKNKVLKDKAIDLENNEIGKEFGRKNPNATDEDILQYAFQQALNNYDRQYNKEPSQLLQQRLMEKEGINNNGKR